MAIKQERMISLINAATEYRNALIDTYKRLASIVTSDQVNIDTYIRQTTELSNIITDLGNRYNAILSIEMHHFAANQSLNNRKREHMETKRRDAGVKIRIPAPRILNATSSLIRYEFNAPAYAAQAAKSQTEQAEMTDELTPDQFAAAEELRVRADNAAKGRLSASVRKTLTLEDNEKVEIGNPQALFVGGDDDEDEDE